MPYYLLNLKSLKPNNMNFKSFKKIYFECNIEPLFERILREEHLREMGLISIQRAANRLEALIKRMIQSHSSPDSDLVTPDKIAENAVKQLISEGSSHNPQNLKSKVKEVPFTPTAKDGDTQKWINQNG
jgi:hypothetical protein